MIERPTRVDWLGYLGAALMLGAFVAVLGHFVDVVAVPGELTSGSTRFYLIVAAAIVAGTVLARVVSIRIAVPLGLALFAGGLWWYLQTIDAGAIDTGEQIGYVAAMAAGQSVLDIQSLETWILGVTPAPVFLGWYLTVRGRYVESAVVGTIAVGTVVLTGDAGHAITLLATIGGLALLAAAAIDHHDGSLSDGASVATIAGIVVIATLSVSIVPASGAYVVSPTTGVQESTDSDPGSLDGGLHPGGDRLAVQGSVSLSPEVLFSVRSDRASYWRTGSYDTYTGGGWIRRSNAAERYLTPPEGASQSVIQEYRIQRRMNAMPAVWRPIALDNETYVLTDGQGGLVPREPLDAGDSYRLQSAAPAATNAQLQAADGPVPADIAGTYQQLPDSTPDRVAERTDRVTANAETPYETAVAIERYLESSNDYSLSVSRPRTNVADSFLFEMDAGYCTYFATTMAVMLRTQDIPARMVTGYGTGQRVGPDEWVVRGQNAHAWVEVYLSGVGWVRFDPTPSGPRTSTAENRLEAAREEGAPNVDLNDSVEGEWTPSAPETTADPSDAPQTTIPPAPQAVIDAPITPGSGLTATTETPAAGNDGDGGDWWLWLIGFGGLAVGVRQSGLAGAGYRLVWLVHQPRSEPAADVERAFERTMALLAAAHRPRRPAEPVADYLDSVGADEAARRVAAIRERSHYGGQVERARADEARAAAGSVRRAVGIRTLVTAALWPVIALLPWSPDSV
ncbi:transglutaminase family protein [Halococcoides cellulosivorans]|uniref:Transglutaminase n=1 Tax=Halococcoides cellulosivorans TaxID=1679096 RepID=A0A2R4WYC9_9EURY|nr:transglutaminaseTgpA domain-containing protein [Halococcoides cellulosivorans]AWB26545.1 transglutaminase [Halococcoides cellulosivorans]